METMEFKIEGMACGDCISKVIRELTAIPDVKVKECIVLKPGLGKAQVTFNPMTTSKHDFEKAILKAGFSPL
ncbi:MAG: heavy-metal-associated domain-containing protein [Fibrobacterota bacterium]|nr:heavy-metal-associated domain-containing protein [Fibrobacterota bacterium]